jgi:hypothetical protein
MGRCVPDRTVPSPLSDALRRWQQSDGDTSLGGLVDTFEERGFAMLFVVLLGVPALPLPTGGATHVMEAVAVLVALQLVVGRQEIWLPQRWRRIPLAGGRRERFIDRLISLVGWLERRSRPRAPFLFERRPTHVVFGLLVIVGSVGAFVAPPFSWLDTLPALGVVVLSMGVLLEDALIVAIGVAIGAGGIWLILVIGRAAFEAIGDFAAVADPHSPGGARRT